MEEELEGLVKQAAKIAEKIVAEKVPDKFQEKCFEILFRSFITGRMAPQAPEVEEIAEPSPKPVGKFVTPMDVRAFLQQNSIPEENLPKIFLMEGTEVKPIFNLETTKKARAQIQLSLLTGLENALRGGKFEFTIENIRERCQELKCYDYANFQSTFKKNKGLFKDLSHPEHVELSPEGKVELAEVISELAK